MAITFSHFETSSGKKLQLASIKGEDVLDILKGISFQVFIEDGDIKVEVDPECANAFSHLNRDLMIVRIREYVSGTEQSHMGLYDPVSWENCFIVSVDEKAIGKFKPKREFLNFVSGKRGGVRLLSKTAFLKGKQISGMIEDVVFKIDILDEGTIDFVEVDTSHTDEDMIRRFVEDICERDVAGYMNKFIVDGIDFHTSDGKTCYLEIDHQKPIDQLFSIFDNKVTLSEDGMSALDLLLGPSSDSDVSDESIVQSKENMVELPKDNDPPKRSFVEDAFSKMNEDKLNELRERAEKMESDILKFKHERAQADKNIDESVDKLRVLQTRIESLSPPDSPNGYVFFVSEEKKTGIVADEKMVEVVGKISPLLRLNSKVVIDMLTGGYYTLKIAKKFDISNFDLDRATFDKVSRFDLKGSLTFKGSGEFEYRGDLNWHQLNQKMMRMGFEQNPEFDQICGSNSYMISPENDKLEVNE